MSDFLERSAAEPKAALFGLVPGRQLDVVGEYLVLCIGLTSCDCGCLPGGLGGVVGIILRAEA